MWNKLWCWLLGHMPEIEMVLDGMIRCARCNQVIGQVPKVTPREPPTGPGS